MSRIFVTGLAVALLGLVAACSGQMEAARLIEEAVAAQNKAASVNGEWRDTGKFIKAAKKAAGEGRFDEAVTIAGKAKAEGELGYEQAVSQQGKVKEPSYLKSGS